MVDSYLVEMHLPLSIVDCVITGVYLNIKL